MILLFGWRYHRQLTWVISVSGFTFQSILHFKQSRINWLNVHWCGAKCGAKCKYWTIFEIWISINNTPSGREECRWKVKVYLIRVNTAFNFVSKHITAIDFQHLLSWIYISSNFQTHAQTTPSPFHSRHSRNQKKKKKRRKKNKIKMK